MKFALHIKSAPYQSQACRTALRFAQTLLKKGHTLPLVFFSSEAVAIANRLASAPQDEEDLQQQWQLLAHSNGITLGICSAAAVRRGVCSKSVAIKRDADQEGQGQQGNDSIEHDSIDNESIDSIVIDNIATGYQLAGLGEWVEAAVESDRVLTFG